MGEDSKHICRFCEKSFPSGRSLGGHMRSHLSSSEPPLEEDNPPRKPCSPTTLSPPCKYCGKVFRSLKALYGHMRCHSDKHPLLGFIGGGEGAPQPRKRKRGSRKPRQDFLGHSSSSASPSSVSEEEAAECLLLLSGGHCVEDHHPSSADSEATPLSADSEAEEEKKKKKKVYTCVTCGRTFDSFQALGGHRAYHNKDCPMEELSRSTVMPSKVHGCNVCEKVFPSGQALGGHMRSHFNAHAKPKREKEMEEEEEPCQAVPITGLFDLNLPAMPEF